jgi:hypothetical protein
VILIVDDDEARVARAFDIFTKLLLYGCITAAIVIVFIIVPMKLPENDQFYNFGFDDGYAAAKNNTTDFRYTALSFENDYKKLPRYTLLNVIASQVYPRYDLPEDDKNWILLDVYYKGVLDGWRAQRGDKEFNARYIKITSSEG